MCTREEQEEKQQEIEFRIDIAKNGMLRRLLGTNDLYGNSVLRVAILDETNHLIRFVNSIYREAFNGVSGDTRASSASASSNSERAVTSHAQSQSRKRTEPASARR